MMSSRNLKLLLPVCCLMIVLACNVNHERGNEPHLKVQTNEAEKESVQSEDKQLRGVSEKHFHEVNYSVKWIPAIDFIEAKGEQIDPEDTADLEHEGVVMLEFSSGNKSQKDVLKSKQCGLSYEKAIEYLNKIEKDVVIEQGNQKIIPTSQHFERDFNMSSKIRVMLFFSGVDPSQELKFVFNDQLFNAGILKFRLEQTKQS